MAIRQELAGNALLVFHLTYPEQRCLAPLEWREGAPGMTGPPPSEAVPPARSTRSRGTSRNARALVRSVVGGPATPTPASGGRLTR
ncbi:hypothetical protein GCM10009660_59770 [Catellatospora bangladeshensis]